MVQTDPFLVFLLAESVNRQRGEFASEDWVENALKLIGVERFQQQFGHLPLIEERLKPGLGEYARLLQQPDRTSGRRSGARLGKARPDGEAGRSLCRCLLHNQNRCQLEQPHRVCNRRGIGRRWHASPLQVRSTRGVQLARHIADRIAAPTLLQQRGAAGVTLNCWRRQRNQPTRADAATGHRLFARQCIAGWQHPAAVAAPRQHGGNWTRRDTDAIWETAAVLRDPRFCLRQW